MRVVIVGAGPSGLMCAIAAARNHHQVFILEKNEKPGKKIYITGKGRCNVTNYCSVNETVNHIVHNGKFLYSALNQFSSTDVMDFFEKRGVKLVIERGNRVFPSSYKASDITRSLTKECEKLGVRIYCHTNITKIEKIDDHFHLEYNKNLFIDADKLVIATGGNSYPLTGSTGDGYLIAKQFSHHIVDIMPGLVALKVSDKVSYDAQGLTLKNVGLHAYNDQVHYVENGEMLFEKGMIDGPIVLKISSLINDKKNIRLYIDLKIG
jgi:hypothetical protein